MITSRLPLLSFQNYDYNSRLWVEFHLKSAPSSPLSKHGSAWRPHPIRPLREVGKTGAC